MLREVVLSQMQTKSSLEELFFQQDASFFQNVFAELYTYLWAILYYFSIYLFTITKLMITD